MLFVAALILLDPILRERAILNVFEGGLHAFLDGRINDLWTTLTSPHLAVSLIENRMPAIPASFMRSTMSFSS